MEKFSDLGLSQSLLKAIEDLGFETPTPIQSQVIPQLLQNQTDLVGLAQTGTGKTAAFGLPMLDLIDTRRPEVQTLILSPTRELCLQIHDELLNFGKYLDGLRITAVYGGADIVRQMRDIKNGVQVVVATPGRLRDLIQRKAIQLNTIDYVILDEADEMLNMGFKEELDDILTHVPPTKKAWLFSATMPEEVRRISKDYMSNPFEVSVGERNAVNEDIEHQYVLVQKSMRYDVLRRFLDYSADTFCLVFCRTRSDARELSEQLVTDGYDADALHGDLNQNQRDRVMAKFRAKHLKVLVATDVAARGIDVQDITHVFHYNIPDDFAFYTHRSGRTGRAGSKGISLILAHPKEESMLRQMAKKLNIKLSLAHIPTGQAICEQRLLHHFHQLRAVEVSSELQSFLPAIVEEFEELSKVEIIERVASLNFNRFLDQYQNAPDLNAPKISTKEKPSNREGFKRLFINIGSVDVESKSMFLKMICGEARVSSSSIGKIEFKPKFTFFDVEEKAAERIIQSLTDLEFDGRPVRVNYDDAPITHSKPEKFGNRSDDFSKNRKPKPREHFEEVISKRKKRR